MILAGYKDWSTLFKNILWIDKAAFHIGGFVNRHNCHYGAEEDPRIIAEKFQNRPMIMVWCRMTSDKIESFISEDTINADRYLTILYCKKIFEHESTPGITLKTLFLCKMVLLHILLLLSVNGYMHIFRGDS